MVRGRVPSDIRTSGCFDGCAIGYVPPDPHHHMTLRSPFLALFAFFALFAFLDTTVNAQELNGIGSIRFILIGPEQTPDVVGAWTLIRPGNERTEGTEQEYTFAGLPAGNYSFTTSLPDGATAETELLLDGQLIKTLSGPQMAIPLDGQENYLIKVTYTYTRAGTVAINSQPAGLGFRLTGPNGIEKRGVTPASYENVPEGQYAAYFDKIEGCRDLPTQSDKLVKDSRITLRIEVVCENLKVEDTYEKELNFVTVSIDGKQVIFEDVPLNTWFSSFIYTAAKTKVLTGYSDVNGNPTGRFGPGDNVTIAQLSKVAHKLGGINETKARGDVENTRARGQWFEQYFASAEQQYWEVWRDRRVDPSRPATRGEVIATFLRVLKVPVVWAEGKTFGDVKPTHPYANAIETAALDGLIDAGGNFRPDDPINRAELAKMAANAAEIYIEDTAEQTGEIY